MEVLRQLGSLTGLIRGNTLLLQRSGIVQGVSRLFLNWLDAEVFNEGLHTLQPLVQLIALRKDHLTPGSLRQENHFIIINLHFSPQYYYVPRKDG